jgi:hypothetical protein
VPNYAAGIGESVVDEVGIDRNYVNRRFGTSLRPSILRRAVIELGASSWGWISACQDLIWGGKNSVRRRCALAHAQYPARRADYGPTLAQLLDGGLAALTTEYAQLDGAGTIPRETRNAAAPRRH